MATVRKQLDLQRPRRLTDEERAELARLDQVADEAIDYTDTPELDESFWQARGHFGADIEKSNATRPQSSYRFEIFRDRAGEIAIRYVHGDEIIFQTLPFSSIDQARNALNTLKAHSKNTPTETII